MKNILSQAHREVLEQFSWSNVLLAFDYDGTLAPIVDDPKRAFMRQTTRNLLEAVVKLYPTIVISGRARDDARRLLHGVRVNEVIGNHGLEPWHTTDELTEQVQRWASLLQRQLASFRGLQLEDKTFSLAVHYRQSREKKKARGAILRAVTLLGDVRVVGGKQVVNLLPVGAPHKGIALERERERLECDTAIYVGDDETDEDVFVLDQPGRLLSIRVGTRVASAATYCIPRQASIDDLLKALIQLRRKVEPRRQAAQ
ncbi:MAG TPA: trehalose-phosphatase [Polyangiaceae bacterium]|nr:trehalose-phosphatase [Polyangiaceae bacterium]